jgi:predicted Zn-dependent protease
MQSRAQEMRYRQVVDHIDFHLVRAKMRAEFDSPQDAVAHFRESLADKRYLSEGGARYGLVAALLRARDVPAAWKEFPALRSLIKGNAMVETLGCRIRLAGGDPDAFKCFREALQTYPGHRALTYEYAEALLQSRQPQAALKVVEARLAGHADDHRLYMLQSRAYALLNRRLALHRAQAEAYVHMGSIPAAIEQLQIGLKAGDGDYYQMSSAEARLRELRRIDAEDRKSGARKK